MSVGPNHKVSENERQNLDTGNLSSDSVLFHSLPRNEISTEKTHELSRGSTAGLGGEGHRQTLWACSQRAKLSLVRAKFTLATSVVFNCTFRNLAFTSSI